MSDVATVSAETRSTLLPRNKLRVGRSRVALRMLLAFVSGCQILTGCAHNMHRRMTIRSEPPGALVLMEGEEVGYTPVGIDFNHYGTREITLIKDGYETVTAMQKIRSPWYQKIPLDFVSDNFSPVKINDRQGAQIPIAGASSAA